MTTHRIHRCIHCRAVYSLQTSGPGSDKGSASYCPDCHSVVLAALQAVPVRFERETEKVTDQEAICLVLAEMERLKVDPPRLFGTPIFSYVPGLHRRTIDGSWESETVSCVTLGGVRYLVARWPGEDPPRVSRFVEKNVETGETKPWRDYP